ncbi:pitrilysin family protein [Lacisediminimonas sp.]|uniref:M16 family metallopeptidase n=1 Tax=Lacisediminimonas sp. TaxID=3060582 RepID=UPI00271A8101|nr:pitrilysin family protein [Lacisediminimonas sp.]MDO8298637.1 pitrilysin family protein [Lacisediminimonas sp.]MDO9219245.1 pitrilysin family protein [Lacisediminimonas sp.]
MLKYLVLVLAFTASGAANAALKIQSWTLPTGVRVYFVENHSIPVLDVSVEFDAGARRDPAGKSGVASMTNAMLARGLREEKLADGSIEPAVAEAQISDGFADIAAQRGGGASMDRAGATLRTLSSNEERDRAVALLARVLAQPAFPQSLFDRDKARNLSAIREELTKPEAIAGKAFWKLLYQDHPYAQQETVESVGAIQRDDLLEFHRRHYVANRAVVALIGDITREQADAIARELTRRLPQGTPLPAFPAVQKAVGAEQRIPHPASQSHILLGTPALARSDPDFFPLTVGNYVLGGGGFVSRLTREVREKRGLAYSVYSYFNPLAQAGPFQAGLQTQKARTDDALKLVRETIAAYLRDGPTEQELKAAKSNLIGGFPLRIDNNRKILDNVAMIGFYQMPLDYLDTWTAMVAKVTVADIRAAFNRKLGANALSTVIVGAPQ